MVIIIIAAPPTNNFEAGLAIQTSSAQLAKFLSYHAIIHRDTGSHRDTGIADATVWPPLEAESGNMHGNTPKSWESKFSELINVLCSSFAWLPTLLDKSGTPGLNAEPSDKLDDQVLGQPQVRLEVDGGAAWENKLLLLVILVCVDDLDVIRALECRGCQAYPTSTALPLSCSLILGQAVDFCRGMEKFTEWGFVRKPSARPQSGDYRSR